MTNKDGISTDRSDAWAEWLEQWSKNDHEYCLTGLLHKIFAVEGLRSSDLRPPRFLINILSTQGTSFLGKGSWRKVQAKAEAMFISGFLRPQKDRSDHPRWRYAFMGEPSFARDLVRFLDTNIDTEVEPKRLRFSGQGDVRVTEAVREFLGELHENAFPSGTRPRPEYAVHLSVVMPSCLRLFLRYGLADFCQPAGHTSLEGWMADAGRHQDALNGIIRSPNGSYSFGRPEEALVYDGTDMPLQVTAAKQLVILEATMVAASRTIISGLRR